MAKTVLRTGITTGTCAAAAAKAALLALSGRQADYVEVLSPQQARIRVPIASAAVLGPGLAKASVVKDAGDDPDITNGAEIVAEVGLSKETGVVLAGGQGVGRVTKPGLAVAVGQPAINPGPRQMITQAVQELLPPGRGAVVTVSIPDGERLAARTLNPLLGIVGGLSVIGTTGIVEPMSEEAFKKSLVPQISMVRAFGYDDIVFTPGKIGRDIAVNRHRLPADAVIQTSNFIGYMLEKAVELGIKRVLLLGHPGKIVKVAAGVFHTHNKMADARLETIAAYLAAGGAPAGTVRRVLACTTTEAAMEIIRDCGLNGVYAVLAERASIRAGRYVFGDLTVGTAIVSLQGGMLGCDSNAQAIGGSLGWAIS